MTSKHVIKLTAINVFFENDNKAIRKGENALESGHVVRMTFDATLRLIQGEVCASMKNKSYKVEADFNELWDIKSAKCSCPRGIKCHHIAALLLFGYHNVSITDQECTWNIMKSKSTDVQTAEQLYPLQKKYTAVDREMTETEVNALRKKLETIGLTVGFTWLLQDEPDKAVEEIIPSIETLIKSEIFEAAEDKVTFLQQRCAVNEEQIKTITQVTKGQRQNDTWFLLRKHRLTASNFGLVLHAVARRKYPASLFKTLRGAYNLDGIKAIQWGAIHEKTAIEQFQKVCNMTVEATGLWLHPSGVLGASPDGLIADDSIIEVKCPYAFRNDVLTEKLKNHSSYIIAINEAGHIVINQDHNYYHQIQGTLHITQRKKCYLIIWTPTEMITVVIEQDPLWAPSLKKLEEFYYTMYIQHLLNN